MPYYQGTQEKHMSITYERNMADPNYQEWIFADGQYIGEIYGGVLEGYELRKVKEIQLAAGAAAVDLETIAYFDTVCDAKSFVNQAGGL
jgi:hypothetical protein